MEIGPLRWASSEGVFLFQVPYEERLFSLETVILLSSSLYAIQIFLDKGDLSFLGEKLSILKLNFHPPFPEEEQAEQERYVVHSTIKDGFCIQSIFLAEEISNVMSEFEKAFLDSVANHVLETLDKEGRHISDIPFLQNKVVIDDVEAMLFEIDTNYKSLAASWSIAAGSDCTSKFNFADVFYNGKIQVRDLFYDLAERAMETFDQLLLGKEEKITLFKIARSLLNLSGLLYSKDTDKKITDEQLNFSHSEIILEAVNSKKLYRLDVRAYTIDDEQFCDITIMG
ncbi:MAG TPA: hypothetical protein VMX55_04795 [candidate division Zixibacteria bacterium]|nr:hypothetical protein [candidate division Zixibacteria bacterium]